MKHWARHILEDTVFWGRFLTKGTRKEIDRIIGFAEENENHYFRTVELENLADELFECYDFYTLSTFLLRLTIYLGFENYSVFVVNQGNSNFFSKRLCTSYSNEWLARYYEKSYQYVDPVATEASRRDGVFLYSELNRAAPTIVDFWKNAEAFGIGKNGVCYTLTQKDGSRVAVTFSTTKGPKEVDDLLHLNGFDLWFFIQQIVDCFCSLSTGPKVSHDKLSLQELHYMYILASRPNPAEALGIISQSISSNEITDSICHKIGVRTIFQAIAIATAGRWFNDLPFGPVDTEVTMVRTSVMGACQSNDFAHNN